MGNKDGGKNKIFESLLSKINKNKLVNSVVIASFVMIAGALVARGEYVFKPWHADWVSTNPTIYAIQKFLSTLRFMAIVSVIWFWIFHKLVARTTTKYEGTYVDDVRDKNNSRHAIRITDVISYSSDFDCIGIFFGIQSVWYAQNFWGIDVVLVQKRWVYLCFIG